MAGRYVAYSRVSTRRQGRSGLGLEAQRKAVSDYLDGKAGLLVGEFVEVETGKRDDRPELSRALALCDLTSATLVVAKLDRLSRDAAFLLTLQKSRVKFVCADMPDANNLTVGIMALIAQQEREAISTRTREALAAAKRRGVKLGGNRGSRGDVHRAAAASAAVRGLQARERADKVRQHIAGLPAASRDSLRAIAASLNAAGITTARGGSWGPSQVRRVLVEDAA